MIIEENKNFQGSFNPLQSLTMNVISGVADFFPRTLKSPLTWYSQRNKVENEVKLESVDNKLRKLGNYLCKGLKNYKQI